MTETLQRLDFEFAASWPRRPRSTRKRSDHLTCLGCRYTLPHTDIEAAGVNIIMNHANGFPKELYETMILEILRESQAKAVYIHDVVCQGASGLRNADLLGDEYSWFDSGRDILAMVQFLRAQNMLDDGPLVGIGHSQGGNQLLYAALLHGNLFESCIVIDPIVDTAEKNCTRPGPNIAAISARRRDTWPSKEDARERFSKSAFYTSWHPEVFDNWIRYGLTSDDKSAQGVKLATTVQHEVNSFATWLPYFTESEDATDPIHHAYANLPAHTIPIHFIFGRESWTVMPEARDRLVARTKFATRVDVPDCDHLLPMQKPLEVAMECRKHIDLAADSWREAEILDSKSIRATKITKEFLQKLDEATKAGRARYSKPKPTSKL